MLQLIIPAYNEELRLPRTLRALRRARRAGGGRARAGRGHRGRQRERRRHRAGRARVHQRGAAGARRAVRRPRQGRGRPCGHARRPTPRSSGFMDADGATALEALDEAWRLLSVGDEVAIGSRAVDGSVTARRGTAGCAQRGARAYRGLDRAHRARVVDTQCGFKLLRGRPRPPGVRPDCGRSASPSTSRCWPRAAAPAHGSPSSPWSGPTSRVRRSSGASRCAVAFRDLAADRLAHAPKSVPHAPARARSRPRSTALDRAVAAVEG